MTVLIAENTPDKVRGLLKRWFIEPKPNVFVGSVNRRTRDKVLEYILKYSPEDLALLVIYDDANSQGFSIRRYRDTSRCERRISGHWLLTIPSDICMRPVHTLTAEELSQFLEPVADGLSGGESELAARQNGQDEQIAESSSADAAEPMSAPAVLENMALWEYIAQCFITYRSER